MKPRGNSSESITDRQYRKMTETPIPRLILGAHISAADDNFLEAITK